MDTQPTKSVLVTGGTKRLGKVIAEVLRERGWRVVTSSHRAEAGADVTVDLSEPLGAARLFAAASAKAGGPLDAIVNNAALFTGSDDLLERVNLIAPQKLTMMLAGRENAVSAVVNIIDAKALVEAEPDEPHAFYLKTKRALLAETRKMAALFADSLRVNAVAPGDILPPEGLHERAGERLLSRGPTPKDVAEAVAFLLEAEATTGAVLPVDGGQGLLLASEREESC